MLVVVAHFAGIIGDFAWRPLVKQVGPASGVVPPSTATPVVGEGGQPATKVDPVATEIAPNAPFSVLAKRKQDDGVGPSGHEKSRASSSFHTLRQAARLTLDSGRPSSVQDLPPTPLAIESHTAVVVTLSPPPPSHFLVQEATPIAIEVIAPGALVGSAVVPLSTVTATLLCYYSMAPPPSSLAPMVCPFTALVSTSTFSHLRISLDHIYTSNDVDSL